MNILKKLLLFTLFFSPMLYSQNTTYVTGTVIDSDSQPWINASWTAVLVVPQGFNPKYKDGTSVQSSYSGILTSSGSFTIGTVLGNTNNILPAGSRWKITISPLASSLPQTLNPVAVTGSTFILGNYVSSQIVAPRIQASNLVYAYNATEVINPVNGNGYSNTSNLSTYLWNGSAWVQQVVNVTSQSIQNAGGIVSNPSSNQSITQPSGTTLSQNINNISGQAGFSYTGNTTIPVTTDGSGEYQQNLLFQSNTLSGYGMNRGNISGIPSNQQGWTVGKLSQSEFYSWRDGINQQFGSKFQVHGLGDKSLLYSYNSVSAGQTDTSGEGVKLISLNGTQEVGFYTGSIISTTGTGDISPVFSSGHNFNSGQYVMDLSKVATSGNFNGYSDYSSVISWMPEQPVTNTLTVSTGFATTNSVINASTILKQPQTQTLNVSYFNSSPLTVGWAWVLGTQDNFNPEYIYLSSVTSLGGTTQQITISSAEPHVSGSYIIQGGVQGCMNYSDVTSMNAVYTSYPVYGSTANYLIWGIPFYGRVSGVNYPNTAYVSQKSNSPYSVYECAQIWNTDNQGNNPVLAPNNVSWSNSDSIVSPLNPAYQEVVFVANGTANTPSDPSYENHMMTLLVNGNSYAGKNNATLKLGNFTSLSHYAGLGGRLKPPPAIQTVGSYGSIIFTDQPFDSDSCHGSLLCVNVLFSGTDYSIHEEQNRGYAFKINPSNNRYYMQNTGLYTERYLDAGLGFLDNGYGGTVGQFLRSNGNAYRTGNIQPTDLPGATSTNAGAVICGTNVDCATNPGTLSVSSIPASILTGSTLPNTITSAPGLSFTVSANALTGTTLASNVVNSSLTSLAGGTVQPPAFVSGGITTTLHLLNVGGSICTINFTNGVLTSTSGCT